MEKKTLFTTDLLGTILNKITTMIDNTYGSDRTLKNRIFNLICLSLVFILTGNVCTTFLFNLDKSVLLFKIPLIIVILLIFFRANRTRKIELASTIFCLLANLTIIVYSRFASVPAQIYFYYILAILSTVYLFRGRKRKALIAAELIIYTVLLYIDIAVLDRKTTESITNRVEFLLLAEALFYVIFTISISFATIVKLYERKNIQLKELNNSLKRMSVTDALTGCWNRKHMVEALNKLIEETKKEKKKLSIIMFDLDHFKNINDTYGHQIGDEILKAFTKIIGNNSPEDSILTRYGGEEFLLLLPNTSKEEALELGDELRERISKRLKIRNTDAIITVSGGISEYEGNEVLEDFIKRADDNLYNAKEHGRNKIVI